MVGAHYSTTGLVPIVLRPFLRSKPPVPRDKILGTEKRELRKDNQMPWVSMRERRHLSFANGVV